MKLFGFLSRPEDRAAVHQISQQVLEEIDPEEAEQTSGFIDAIMKIMASAETSDEYPTIDISDEAGGFGGADLLVLVVVPVVVAVLIHLFNRLGDEGIEALKNRTKQAKNPEALLQITEEEIKVAISRTKSPRGKREIKKLVKAVNRVLLSYLMEK